MYKSRKMRGMSTQLDLVVLAFVVILIVLTSIGLQFIAERNIIIGKQNIRISQDIDDRGSEILSIISSTHKKKTVFLAQNVRAHTTKYKMKLKEVVLEWAKRNNISDLQYIKRGDNSAEGDGKEKRWITFSYCNGLYWVTFGEWENKGNWCLWMD